MSECIQRVHRVLTKLWYKMYGVITMAGEVATGETGDNGNGHVDAAGGMSYDEQTVGDDVTFMVSMLPLMSRYRY